MPIQRKYDFQPGTRISSGQIDEEFDQLINAHNQTEERVNETIPYSGATKDVDLNTRTVRNGTFAYRDAANDGIYYQWNEDNDGVVSLKSRNMSDYSMIKNLINGTSEGIISFPNQSFVEAERDYSWDIGVGVEYKVITFTEYKDIQSEFTYSTGEFKPKQSGVYLFTVSARWNSIPTSPWYSDILVNSSVGTPAARVIGGAPGAVEQVGAIALRLSMNDVVSFKIFHSDSVSRSLGRYKVRIAKVS